MQDPKSFLWHDYETFGTDPFADRPAQFAAIRTDTQLNPLGEPIDWFCAPATDVLPHPGACLVTGITPQQALAEGVCEARFARRIHAEMMEPGTCIVGYNSLRFDDQFTRNLFYRNFYDPYAHEYSEGNSRWDLIDLVRMFYALRPDGIEWPSNDKGLPSFKLEHLTHANQISHQDAHDALSDVRATIAMARLLLQSQPRLFRWGLGLRDQKAVAKLLNPVNAQPVLLTSSRITAARGCTSLVLPLAIHPHYRKSVIVFDLMADPEPLINESAEDLHQRVFTPNEQLPPGVDRLPLQEIKTNGVPMVAPASVLKGVDCQRIALDPERCMAHAERLLPGLPALGPKVMDIYASPPHEAVEDPDLQIYSGSFFSRRDKQTMAKLRATPPERIGSMDWPFEDRRLPEMLFRYRARNFPETLQAHEMQRWEEWRQKKLQQPPDPRQIDERQFWLEVQQARAAHPESARTKYVLDHLEQWATTLGLGA